MLDSDQSKLADSIIEELGAANPGAFSYLGMDQYRGNDLVRFTVDQYLNEGLRGRKLRIAVKNEFDIPIIMIFQLAVVILQIIYYIKKLWS